VRQVQHTSPPVSKTSGSALVLRAGARSYERCACTISFFLQRRELGISSLSISRESPLCQARPTIAYHRATDLVGRARASIPKSIPRVKAASL
jgi:hypothetical protein